MIYGFNPNTGEGEVSRSLGVAGQPGLQREIQGSQIYREKPHLKKQKKK